MIDYISANKRTLDVAPDINLEINWVYDDAGDMSHLGEFTDKRGEWTVDRKTGVMLGDWETVVKHLPPARAQAWCDEMEELGYTVTDCDSPMRGWWECHASGYRVVRDNLPTRYDSREYRYFKLSDVHGYNPPADAEELGYLVQDYERAHRYTIGDWSFMGCIVTVRAAGAKVGYDSLWGIESDSGDEYRREVERGCISAALASVTEQADKLRAAADALASIDVDALVNSLAV